MVGRQLLKVWYAWPQAGSVTEACNTGSQIGTICYDGLARRISKTVSHTLQTGFGGHLTTSRPGN